MPMNRPSTNMGKLVGWDIDEYLTLSDDDGCLVCLTERDKYVLGQATRQMRWATRWDTLHDTPLPDILAIADRMDFLMSEENCIDICDEIIACIEDSNTGVAEAIRRASNSEYYNINQTENITILLTDTLSGQAVSQCDKDNLFGATTQIVDLLNTMAEDILELFETAFATPSRLGDIIEAIPGVGLLPFDDVLQLLEKMSQQVKSAYDSAYDSQLRDDFRCELLCIAEEDCTLTMEQIRDYYKDKISVDVSSAISFLTLINDIIANNWLGLQAVYLMHWFILDAIIFGTEVLGIDVNRIVQQISVFWNDPDEDWNGLCDPCNQTWEQTFDFTIDEQGWDVFGVGQGVYVAGVGFRSVQDNNETRDYIAYDGLGAYNVTELVVNGSWTGDGSPDYQSNSLVYNDGSGNLMGRNERFNSDPPDSDTIFMDSDVPDGSQLRFFVYASGFSPVSNGSIYTMTSLTLKGNGVNPFA